MTALPPITNTHPSSEQWEKVEALASTLSPEQAIWLSGYFSGLGQCLRAERGGDIARIPAPSLSAQHGEVEAAVRNLTILYGSETGNSADLARQIETRASALGIKAIAADMASYKTRRLKDEQDLLIVTSTHGEGDPPEPAADFFEFLDGAKAPNLVGLRYAVLGLGDSTYEFFCGASRRLDERFAELGAERFHERLDCDVDYEDQASAWVEDVLAKFAKEAGAAQSAKAPVPAAPGATSATQQVSVYDKRNPFAAEVLSNIVLTGRGSGKETRHIELSLEGAHLSYEPGDALGLVPRNDPRLVETLLGATGLDPDETVELKNREMPLAHALEGGFEICVLTPRFLEHWANLSDATPLRDLLTPANKHELSIFMRENHILDLVRAFPVPGLTADKFVAGLRGLQPRLYSIASSASAAEEEVHLTVSAVRYQLKGEPRAGVASSFLAERLGNDDRIPVYVQSNPHFRLPTDDETPIIMVGAGTGIAPYRAFLQEREVRGAEGRSWLFFGERNFRTDFLYQLDWQTFLKDGVLSQMDVAFSRDQAEKVYVHHRLRERARDIFAWLEEGAHFYVCGDAAALAPDVHQALSEIVADQGGLGSEKADEYVRSLQRDGRYQRDVY